MTEQRVKVCAVMGAPRVGWTDNWVCIAESVHRLGIPVRAFTGAFWGHNISNVLECCVNDGIDWALTIDYDTLFTAKHLQRMLELFHQRQDIDALAALQTKRDTDVALLSIDGSEDMQLGTEPVRADTAHFGLTLIRLEKLRDMPMPWFWDQPSAAGSWNHDDKVDADIYFWNQWAKHGNSLYVAPDVRVGHLELRVSEFDENGNFRHRSVKEWMAERNT